MNEDLYSSSSINEIPVDIENTICGEQMTALIETISGINSIQPYCDVALRILMRIADLMQGRYLCYEADIT
jgi:hypothetical protein